MFHFMVCKRACGEPQGSVLGQLTLMEGDVVLLLHMPVVIVLSSSSDHLITLNLGLVRSQTVSSKI